MRVNQWRSVSNPTQMFFFYPFLFNAIDTILLAVSHIRPRCLSDRILIITKFNLVFTAQINQWRHRSCTHQTNLFVNLFKVYNLHITKYIGNYAKMCSHWLTYENFNILTFDIKNMKIQIEHKTCDCPNYNIFFWG